MLLSWRDGKEYTIAEAMSLIGEPWLSLWETGDGVTLNGHHDSELATKLDWTAVVGQSMTIGEWARMLSTSPLFVTIRNSAGLHAILVTGISGDGKTAKGTLVTFIDPDGGTMQTVSFANFVTLYEGGVDHPIQVRYGKRGGGPPPTPSSVLVNPGYS